MKEKIKGIVASIIFRVIALLTLGQISPILSACIIIERDGKFLLIDRSDGLGYTIPGGIVRYKETVEQCVLREAREETGYTVVIQFRAASIAYKGSIVSGSEHKSGEGKPCWHEPGEVFGRMAFDCEEMLKDYLSGKQRFA